MASDRLVTPEHLLKAVMEQEQRGSINLIQELEKLEPDLMEYLLESLTPLAKIPFYLRHDRVVAPTRRQEANTRHPWKGAYEMSFANIRMGRRVFDANEQGQIAEKSDRRFHNLGTSSASAVSSSAPTVTAWNTSTPPRASNFCNCTSDFIGRDSLRPIIRLAGT